MIQGNSMIPRSIGDNMIPDDYVYVEDCAELALKNGWLSAEDIFNYIKEQMKDLYLLKKQRKIQYKQVEYIEKLRDYLNELNIGEIKKKIIADEI